MTEMLKVNHSILTDAERLTLATRILSILEKVTIEECAVATEFTQAITKASDQLSQALGKTAATTLTEAINSADDQRDEALNFIYRSIKLFQEKRDPQIAKASQLLKEIYDEAFIGINLNNKSEESAGIERFFEKLENAEAQTAIVTIHIDEEVKSLKESHTKYVALVVERAQVKETRDTPSLVPSRKKFKNYFNALQSFVNFKVDNGNDLYTNLAEEMNSPITEIMSVARSRNTRKSNN